MDYAERFVVVCSAGIGVTLLGGWNLAVRPTSLVGRFLAPLVVAAGIVGMTTTLLVPLNHSLLTGGIVLATAGLMALTRPVSQAVRAALLLVDRKAATGILTLATGITAIIAGVITYTQADEERIEREMGILTMADHPPSVPLTDVHARTDRGTPIELRQIATPRSNEELANLENEVLATMPTATKLIRRQPADDVCNCHGWTFTGGRYWIGSDAVKSILAENGYQPVQNPQAGDVVVYTADDLVIHTGIVRYVERDMPTLIESKWGWMGVYLHPVEVSLYGQNYHYYRTSRSTHQVAGFASPADAPAAQTSINP